MQPCGARLGVLRTQPLGTAHRLVPEAQFLPADRDMYRARMEATLDALARFTPSLEADAAPDAKRYGQILLGIEGLHRLWGDDAQLTERIVAAARPLLPGEPRVGIGNTRFGAQVAAVVGRGRLEVIAVGDAAAEAAYLAPLSISLLPADDDTRERLRVFGLTRIGEFAALARSAVIARFGAHGGMLHDLARGMTAALWAGRALSGCCQADLDRRSRTQHSLRRAQPVWAAVRQLAAWARARRGLLLVRSGSGRASELEQTLPEPSASADLLERLLIARLATILPVHGDATTIELRGEQSSPADSGPLAPQPPAPRG